MTTAAWSTVLDQTSDAAFRVWVAEFIAKCLAVGLTQTTDTGQINTTTVTRAGANTDAGYAIFRFNDTQQATAPIFIKVMFGSGTANTVPRIRIQVGTASNGSGTVSGTGSANTDTISATTGAVSTVTLYSSYMCYVDGSWSFAWKIGAYNGFSGAPNANYALTRSTDNNGVATADAVSQLAGPTNPFVRTISFLTSTVYSASNFANWAFIPYGVTTSIVTVAGVPTPQVFKTEMVTPRVRPMAQTALVLNAEFNIGVQFSAALVGATPRNFISAIPLSLSVNLAMLWE